MDEVLFKSAPVDNNFGKWLKELVCRCSQMASEKNYKVFGVTDSGECKSSRYATGESTFYSEYGSSTKCYNGQKEPCDDNTNNYCIGNKDTIYVYGPSKQKPEPQKPCEVVVDLGFVVDGSKSISEANFTLCKTFIKNVIKLFNVSQSESHVGLVLFSNEAEVKFTFNRYYDLPSIEKEIDGLTRPNDFTNIAAALKTAHEGLFQPTQRLQYKRILVFMTDGHATMGEGIGKNAKLLKNEGIHIISVGIGDNYDLDELKTIATDDSYVFTTYFDRLSEVVEKIRDRACKEVPTPDKLVTFTSKPVDTLYVRVGMEARFAWQYVVLDREKTFKQYSPIWYVYGEGGEPKELASENKDNGWKWSESSNCPERYRGRISKEGQATLVLSSVTLADGATYGCSLEKVHGAPVVSQVKLVPFNARFSKTPEAVVYVKKGEDARLQWEYVIDGGRNIAFSAFSPTWSFYQNEHDVEIASEDKSKSWAWAVSQTCPESLRGRIKKESLATLVISKVTMEDSGFYTCSLVMTSGEPVISRVQLIVQDSSTSGKVIEVKFTKVPPEELKVLAGTTVNLNWEYEIINGDRNEAFMQYSPTWDLYYSPGEAIQLAAEDKKNNWSWAVSKTCPASLSGRITKFSSANLVISSLIVSDSGVYGCTLNLISGNSLTAKVNLIVTEPEPCQVAIDLVFLLDLANTKAEFEHIKKFAKKVARGFKISQEDTHVAVMVYSMEAYDMFNLKKYYDIASIESAIDQIDYSKFSKDGNNIGDAIYLAKDDIFSGSGRPEASSVVILVTDGKDNELDLKTVKGYGLKIYSVGIGMGVNVEQLEGMAASPDNVFNAGSYSDLSKVSKRVQSKVCADFTAGPTPKPTPEPIVPCKTIVDLVFLLDGSSSISDDNFKLCRNFIKTMVANFKVSKEESHIGLAQFANKAQLEFGLDKYYTQEKLDEAIEAVTKKKGGTFIGRGLTKVKDQIFAESPKRQGVPRILLVMTDGESENGDDLTTPSKTMKDQGVTIFSLGIGDRVDSGQLKTIASDPDSEHVFKTSFSQLLSVVDLIKEKACPDKKPFEEDL